MTGRTGSTGFIGPTGFTGPTAPTVVQCQIINQTDNVTRVSVCQEDVNGYGRILFGVQRDTTGLYILMPGSFFDVTNLVLTPTANNDGFTILASTNQGTSRIVATFHITMMRNFVDG